LFEKINISDNGKNLKYLVYTEKGVFYEKNKNKKEKILGNGVSITPS